MRNFLFVNAFSVQIQYKEKSQYPPEKQQAINIENTAKRLSTALKSK